MPERLDLVTGIVNCAIVYVAVLGAINLGAKLLATILIAAYQRVRR